jgi:hypothetical protein
MQTRKGSTVPVIVFANSKSGKRVPMRVSVAPVFDEKGEVVGGVETFQDLDVCSVGGHDRGTPVRRVAPPQLRSADRPEAPTAAYSPMRQYRKGANHNDKPQPQDQSQTAQLQDNRQTRNESLFDD